MTNRWLAFPMGTEYADPIDILRKNKYAIPKVGPLLYDYDRVKDSVRKDLDFKRNTGRDYYYRTDSNSARAQRDLSYDFEFVSPTASFGTKTFKWFI